MCQRIYAAERRYRNCGSFFNCTRPCGRTAGCNRTATVWGGFRNSLQRSVPDRAWRCLVWILEHALRTKGLRVAVSSDADVCVDGSLSWGVLWRLLGSLWCLRPMVLGGQWRHLVWDTPSCRSRRTGLRRVWYCRLGCGLVLTVLRSGRHVKAVTNFPITVAPKILRFPYDYTVLLPDEGWFSNPIFFCKR